MHSSSAYSNFVFKWHISASLDGCRDDRRGIPCERDDAKGCTGNGKRRNLRGWPRSSPRVAIARSPLSISAVGVNGATRKRKHPGRDGGDTRGVELRTLLRPSPCASIGISAGSHACNWGLLSRVRKVSFGTGAFFAGGCRLLVNN